MNLNLSNEDFAILLALESNPFMPMTELATLLEVTRVTAKKRVEDLKEREIIRNPIAIYNPFSLGLKRVNVLAFVQSLANLELLELACKEHPYTHYRARVFGGGFGLFMQFDTPLGTTKLVDEFFSKLKRENILLSYELLPSTDIRTEVYADLTRFNAKMSSWNFSWKNWFAAIGANSRKLPSTPEAKIDYTKFNKSHFKILQLLTSNGSLKQTDIKDKLNLSRTQAHREFNYVMDNYIEQIRFIYDREIFDLTEAYITIGYDVSQEKAAQIYHAVTTKSPPFRLALDVLTEERILLWGNMSPAQASGFAFSMWENIDTTKIYTLDTKKSTIYWFYPENFDFDNFQWKTDKGYVLKEPLDRLLALVKS